MHKKRFFLGILVIVGVLLMIPHIKKEKKQEWDKYSGIPDVVSSTTIDNSYNLIVVANSEKIEDKEKFAREVIHMCRDNSFRTIKFSTDIRGYPSKLDITVYLTHKDVEEKKDPVCEIEFKSDNYNENYDIKNNPDKFHLYLDGKEIEL